MVYLLIIVVTLYLFIVLKRLKKYKYNQRLDYIYNLEEHCIQKGVLTNSKIDVINFDKSFDTVFLKVTLTFNFFSYFCKPFIQINNTKHYFEFAAQGVRYINISHEKLECLEIQSKNLSIKKDEVLVYGYKNSIDLTKKIVIFAPHADDAEIAAFGLYKTSQNVTIVTTTIGENGVCNYCDLYDKNKTQNSLKKAELRTFDALATPMLGGVEVQNSLALGYFGGTLKYMSTHPNENVISKSPEFGSMNKFRKVSHASVQLEKEVEANYQSFTTDIKEIIMQINPDIIITPHPTIDSHSDHKQTTVTVCDVLAQTHCKADLLLYTNHLEQSELYPIGSIHSSIDLPPNIKEFYFESIYSFGLNHSLQLDKFFALESIHDLRNSLLFISIKHAYKHLSKMIKRKIMGKDKSYFRRALRANELFFVVKNKNIDKLQ